MRFRKTALAAAFLLIGGCGDAPSPQPASPGQAASCLRAAGLANIEDLGGGVLRAVTPAKRQVLLTKLPTAAAAREAVRQATLVSETSVGPYVINGGVDAAATAPAVRMIALCLSG